MRRNDFASDHRFGTERYRDLLDDHFYPYIAEGRRPRRFDKDNHHDRIRQMKLKIDLELELRKGQWQDIEEKVVRWPSDGNPHTAFFYETESCSRPGMVTHGWVRNSEAETLLYAFEIDKRGLDIYFCEQFQEIKARFWAELRENPNRFPCSRNMDKNQSQGRLVPIGFIVCNFNIKRYFLGHYLEVLIRLALITGMRRDELLSLKWQDINLESRILLVQNAKTKSSARMIPIPPDIALLLKEHHLHQMEAQGKAGLTWANLDLVFPKDLSAEDSDNQQTKKSRQRGRRIKGTGSVYPRQDGRWRADFIEEATGKKKTLYGKTAKEAQDKLDKALFEQKQGILATGPNQKLADHLEWWLEEVHKVKLRTSTYVRYRGIVDAHILPELGHIQLRKLTARHIQSFYNKKLKENLSPASVHKIHGILHCALKSAVKWRHISFNPADGIELPPDKPQREGQSLTLEQSRLLLKEAQGHRLEAFIALALTTGMRHGELAALRWDDVNFERGTVYIHRTVGYRGRYHFIEGDPKTEKSRRTVPLLPVMHDILESHRTRQNAAKLKAGDSWQEKNLVFCTRDGGFWDPTHTRADFHKLLENAGLPRVRIHDLRHTASTLWQSLGIDAKVRQEVLGHSTLEMTMTVYSHVLPEMQKEAAERINKLFQDPDLGG